jgi:hypothetical protein
MTSAQKIIDTCEKHGCINWKQLRELVNRDREKGAKEGEYKEW